MSDQAWNKCDAMKLYTVIELAEMLKLSKSKVYELAGIEIPVVRIGGAVRFVEEDVRNYIASCKEIRGEGTKRVPRPKLKHIKL